MGPSTGDGGRSRNSILLAMSDRDWRWLRRRRGIDDRVTDVARQARPSTKPRPEAQWDEAAGRWEVWSEDRQGWVSLEDGTVQAPGTRSVDPSPDGVLKPPPLDLH